MVASVEDDAWLTQDVVITTWRGVRCGRALPRLLESTPALLNRWMEEFTASAAACGAPRKGDER